jgi:hypothetical protein
MAMRLPAEQGYDGFDLAAYMRFDEWAMIMNQAVFIDNSTNNSRCMIHMSIETEV